MQAFVTEMFAINSTGNASVSIDLGRPRPFLAWATVTMIDSLSSFDRDNAIAADIFTVDGVRLSPRISGGDHWGPPGSGSNVFPGAITGFGRRISIFLRVFHIEDLEAYGDAIVVTLD
jgi:hypothetical protein